ncbi:MAG TPA: hypothetical protein VGX51_02285 [Solirubrobacteraceae bacterium]|jgi:hypothetical protein|nr:hypothetical protein [Solirubrobacteraceae bacterium]
MSESHTRLDVLRWAASLGAVTAPALALRDVLSLASARATLAAAVRRGDLARFRPLAGHPALHTLTARGARRAGIGSGAGCRVSPANAPHLIACALAAAGLQRCYPDRRVVGERELRHLERLYGIALASAELAAGVDKLPHTPDLVLLAPRPDVELPVAVEVELTLKAPRRLEAICSAWARCRQVAGVLYVASDEARRGVQRAIERAGAGDRVAVLSLDALPVAPPA